VLGLVHEAQARAETTAAAAAMWQARAEMLTGQLADLREHVRALEAPKVEQVAPPSPLRPQGPL
jgi:hypothetical protein